MKRIAAVVAAVAMAAPTLAQPAQPPQLSLEHRMLLRCSAAFALVARWQQGGRPEVRQYPPLAERGKEFFVRASAQVMDEAKLDRDGIEAALMAETLSLLPNGAVAADGTVLAFAAVDAIMPACLSALDAAGL